MAPKKKLKSTEAKHVEEQNRAEYCKNELSVANTENVSTRLSLLPSELLFSIFKFLPPEDLLSLSQLGDPKLREVAEYQRALNFSICRRASLILGYYFSRENVKHIQNMNFNGYIFSRPCDLVRVICRCKNLVNLSIIECAIHYKHLVKILKSCTVLKDLSWSIKDPVHIEPDCHSSVTRLFLLFDIHQRTMGACKILQNFPGVENAIICCSPDALTLPPFNASWSKSFSLSSNDNLRWITIILDALHLHEDSPAVKALTLEIKKFLELQSPGPREDIIHSSSYDHPPFLKLKSQDLDISFLSSCSSGTYSNVVMCLSSVSFDVYERLFRCISKITGSELKHLSIECENYDSTFTVQIPYMQPVLYQTISNLLETLLLDCKNITVLNFGTVHFGSDSPFKAMCNLKNLKFLNVPTCAFPKNLSNSGELCKQEIREECSSFEELVSKCCNVEDFHLVCCYFDKGKMLDSEIFPIKNWKRLTSFTIYSVIFSSCRFLRKIADCCLKFQIFSYINSADNSGCIFYEDVIYLLTHAKNLNFIRINCRNFNPQFERFLDAVSMAKNLEGICFVTNVNTYFNTSAFLTSIRSLKYLHLFHFYAPRVSDCFYAEVRKSMYRNNIKNIKVENQCLASAYPEIVGNYFCHGSTERTEFFHTKPSFTCKHMHFKMFLFDSCSYFNTM